MANLGDIYSGYQSRSAIVPATDGPYRLLQLRDLSSQHEVAGSSLTRFQARLSPSDVFLRKGDVLFLAKGAANFAIAVTDVPSQTLAAGYFFVIRTDRRRLLSEYLAWYLNQAPAQTEIQRQSGRCVLTPTVRRAVLENLEIPVPALPVQQRIVDTVRLLAEELGLLETLGRERQKLVTQTCLLAIHENLMEE